MPSHRALQRPAHMFSIGYLGDTRAWFPCMDDWRMKCKWSIRLAVAPSLVAVSCGQLKEQGLTPDKHHMVFHYIVNEPTPACYIGLAVGPFEALVCPDIPSVTYFTLPGMQTLVSSTVRGGRATRFWNGHHCFGSNCGRVIYWGWGWGWELYSMVGSRLPWQFAGGHLP